MEKPVGTNDPFVTIAIPVLNEEKFLKPLFESLGCLNGEPLLPGNYEIIVVDGGSSDRTLDILSEFQKNVDFKIVHNANVIQSAGINLAADVADPRSQIMVRIDAHAIYEPNFVAQVVRSLIETDAKSVVVPLITRAQNDQAPFAEAVEIAQLSKVGNGGAAHRLASTPAQWVDHGHHAGFDLHFFREIGGYDETFVTNEDAEYDTRVLAHGGRIWLEPKARAWYCPRETPQALSLQYYKYGIGRASTIFKHMVMPKPRQIFPVIALIANVISLLIAVFSRYFLLIPFGYLLICYLAVIYELRSSGKSNHQFVREKAAFALVLMHMSWAFGFIHRAAIAVTKKKTR